MTNVLVICATTVVVCIIAACAYLTAHGDVSGELFITGVISPIVVAITGVVAHGRGVRQGAQAVVDPPPDA